MRSKGAKDDAAAYYVDSTLGPNTYDHIYAQFRTEMDKFYVACARTYGGPLFEIGCGTGLISWALAREGHDVVGIDLSTRMLDIARSKKDENSPSTSQRIDFQEADMVGFQLGRKFKTVIIPGRSFQHLLTPGEQRSALDCIHGHLDAGGTLILDQYDPKLDYCLPDVESPVKLNEIVDQESGRKIRRVFLSRTTDPLTQTFTEQMLLEVLDDAGVAISQEETHWSLRWTYQQEMRYLFDLTGFDVEQLYSDYNYGKPAYAKEQIWICRKA